MKWPVSRLDELADSCLGKMLDKQKNRGTPRPYLRNINVRWGTIDLHDVQEMPFEADELERYSVRKGDLVVCEGGEPGRCAVWNQTSPMFIQKALHRVRCGPDLAATFLAYWLRHLAGSGKLAKQFSGTTIQHLPGVKLATLDVPHPPVSEQHRIVAAIETHFSRLDAAVASLTRAKANVKRARASVLKAAVEGRLVPTEAALARAEGRDYEPAAVLLVRILEERKARWPKGKKYVAPVAPELGGLPGLPEGWVWASVDQTSVHVRNGYSLKPDEDGPTPILRISSVRPCAVDATDSRRLRASIDDVSEFVVNPGDLLFTRYNGTKSLVGVCGMLRAASPMVYPDKLIRVVVAQGCRADFIEKAVSAGHSRKYIQAKVKTTAGQAGISGGEIKAVPVPLSPLAEQFRIVAEADRRLSVLDALEATLDANLARCDRLRQSILKRAFEGRLVPADAALLAAEPELRPFAVEHG